MSKDKYDPSSWGKNKESQEKDEPNEKTEEEIEEEKRKIEEKKRKLEERKRKTEENKRKKLELQNNQFDSLNKKIEEIQQQIKEIQDDKFKNSKLEEKSKSSKISLPIDISKISEHINAMGRNVRRLESRHRAEMKRSPDGATACDVKLFRELYKVMVNDLESKGMEIKYLEKEKGKK